MTEGLMTAATPATTLASLRRMLLVLLTCGLAGTAIDLSLIGHYEDEWQLIPLAMAGLAMVATGALAVTAPTSGRAATVLQLFRSVMVLLMLTGVVGAVLHYRANMEFKLEMDPSLSGLKLFISVVRAKAPPSMAPGSLVLFGLIGLAAAYRRSDYTRLENRQPPQE
jgi:hypothetical protein